MSELTVMVPIGDREVEMRKPTEGAVVVLAKIFRRTSKIENDGEMSDDERARAIRNIGVLGDVIDSMIVKDADRDWLEGALIGGDVEPAEAFAALRTAGEKLNNGATPAKAKAPVRRVRAR